MLRKPVVWSQGELAQCSRTSKVFLPMDTSSTAIREGKVSQQPRSIPFLDLPVSGPSPQTCLDTAK